MQKLINGKHETEWITISTDEYDSMLRTIDTLSRPGVMKRIQKAEKERTEGKMKSLEQVKRDLGL